MIRKWMTALMAMILALMLPLCALADIQHTLTIIPGDDLAAEEAIADLLDVLSLTLTLGDESGALSIGLADQNVLTAAASADSTGLYVHSNILSDDVLYITWEDGIAMLTQLAAAELSAEEAQAFQQSMEQAKDQMLKAAQSDAAQLPAALTAEEGIALVKEVYGDDPAMLEYAKNIYQRMVISDGEFTSDVRDTATQKLSILLTNDDLIQLCDSKYMRTMVETIVLAEEPDLQGEELNKTIDAMLEEVREIYRNMEMNTIITVYTADEGQDLVGMEMAMPMNVKVNMTGENGQTQQEEVSINTAMTYNRLTDNNGVSYKANLNMMLPEEEGGNLEMLFELHKGADKVSKGRLALLAAGEEITITYDASSENGVRNRLASLYLRSGASAIIEPAASARPLISFKVVTQPADPAVLAAVEAADSTNAVNLLKLSEEEMQALAADIEARAMQIVFNAMGNLPASVLTLLMNTAQ